MNSYQAIFDATRLSLANCDVGAAVNDAIRATCDGSYAVALAQEAISGVQSEMTRPSVLFRPLVFQDGNGWLALYGENIQEGVVGCGKSPEAACRDFDNAWCSTIPVPQPTGPTNKGEG